MEEVYSFLEKLNQNGLKLENDLNKFEVKQKEVLESEKRIGGNFIQVINPFVEEIEKYLKENEIKKYQYGSVRLRFLPSSILDPYLKFLESKKTELEGKLEIEGGLVEEETKAFKQALKDIKEYIFFLEEEYILSEEESGLVISPKKIVIPNQKRSSGISALGTSSRRSVDKTTGNVIFELPENTSQYFSNIEIEKPKITTENITYPSGETEEDVFSSLERGVKLNITEQKADGSSETWSLVYGEDVVDYNPEKEKQEPCIKITCESGNVTNVFFGTELPSLSKMTLKPILAFRGFKNNTKLDIKIDYSGKYHSIYPEPTKLKNNLLTWNCNVLKTNQVQVENSNKQLETKKYPYLFWDGITDYTQTLKFETGFCVSKDNLIEFLEDKCKIYGLDEQLTTDFITFWLPFLQMNEFNLIRFLTPTECEELARLEIKLVENEAELTKQTKNKAAKPKDKLQIIRFYMAFSPITKSIQIPAQTLQPVKLKRLPKVFDWGGFCVG